MRPIKHAESSVKEFGGSVDDYLEIHELLDDLKSCCSDVRYRALTHNSWFIEKILPKIFGDTIINSDNIEVFVSDIGNKHVMEDLNIIPSVYNVITSISFHSWVNGNLDSDLYPRLISS